MATPRIGAIVSLLDLDASHGAPDPTTARVWRARNAICQAITISDE